MRRAEPTRTRKRGKVGSIPVHHGLAKCLDAAGHDKPISAPVTARFLQPLRIDIGGDTVATFAFLAGGGAATAVVIQGERFVRTE